MLSSFQRVTVEAIRRHKGTISIQLDKGEGVIITPDEPDRQLKNEIALALQGFYNRKNKKSNEIPTQGL